MPCWVGTLKHTLTILAFFCQLSTPKAWAHSSSLIHRLASPATKHCRRHHLHWQSRLVIPATVSTPSSSLLTKNNLATSPKRSTFALRQPLSVMRSTDMKTSETETEKSEAEDPYQWLEEVESQESLAFAKEFNKACLDQLGDPKTTKNKNEESVENNTYNRILSFLESDDRIPHVSVFGKEGEGDEEDYIVYNFWKDAKNTKGIWRKTTLTSYQTSSPEWTTVLDLDALGQAENVSWVWKGARPLPRSRDDPTSSQRSKRVERALVMLSRGGADATVIREFDFTTQSFVEKESCPFELPEAKTRISYKSRNVTLVGSDFGPDSLTDSGYPRTVREWVRGTPIEEAEVILEGDKTDVSVAAYVDDQRHRKGGGLYEVHGRSLTFYTSKQWVRRLQPEHLLPSTDPKRQSIPPPQPMVELDVPLDADIDLFGQLLLVSLRSDWIVNGNTFSQGSLLSVNFDAFVASKNDADKPEIKVVFAPTEGTALETYSETKNYLILSIMDNVKSRLQFYTLDDEGQSLVQVGKGDNDEALIRSVHVGGFDPHESDLFWFTTSGFQQPSTLYLADASRVASPQAVDDESKGDKTDAFITHQLKALPPQYNATDLQVEQRFATSKDGTRIPYFFVRKRNLGFDNGVAPTLLYGYGGFEVSLGPHYVAGPGIAWLERGGVYVEANIRGGGEFGPKWHQAALKENRNRAYEDFIAVAEDLIASSVCSPATLGIKGGSNGGLLMGNMLTMRPDLFGAIHCAVPLLDMKRYHLLLAGASWMAEYGNPSTDDWSKFLYKYSPYQNVDTSGKTDYPPILFTTSTRDDRVHPGHARKMVKKLADLGKGKVYYYENMEGGHGGAADSKQSAFMSALAYDFMWNVLSEGV